ncbi:MAG: type II secretion system F family protein [Bacteroidota bacterium]
MSPLGLLSSALMGLSVGLAAAAVGRMLRLPEGGAAVPSKREVNKLLSLADTLPLVRVLTLRRLSARRSLLPKVLRNNISGLWLRSGRVKSQEGPFVARLEVLVLMSFGGIFLPLFFLFGPSGGMTVASMYGLVVGYLVYSSLRGEVERRLQSIDRELPYALDLLAMMLAGGGNIYSSLEVLGQSRGDSPLMRELRGVTASLYAGKTFLESLREFSERTDLDNLRGVVLAVEQGERLGTPLHVILRSHAATIRNKRVLAAEEYAHTAGTKVFIPATLVMLALFIIILAPSIIKMMQFR